MGERSSSSTAMRVAELRAAHQLIDGEPKIFSDPIVIRLLDAEVLEQIQSNTVLLNAPWLAGMRSHVLLRSRYTEDRLAEVVSSGVDQFVILGAGYDTFAYRQPEWASRLRIFEVDHPASQRAKQERLAAKGIAIPPNVEFVPIDFEHVSLQDGLSASSLNSSRPAFFSCLGVLVYLTEEAAYAVFKVVASFPKSSEIVFTFSQPDSALDGAEAARRAALASIADSMGEPWRTHFDRKTLIRRLRELGFTEVSVLNPGEAQMKYFRGRNDGLRPPRRENVASARK
jgi:methyltransferase (TIGR00027 family)